MKYLFQMTMAMDEVTERLSALRTPIRESTPSDISSPADGARSPSSSPQSSPSSCVELDTLLHAMSSRGHPPPVVVPHSSPCAA
jgi:hypothetical protein